MGGAAGARISSSINEPLNPWISSGVLLICSLLRNPESHAEEFAALIETSAPAWRCEVDKM
jgi:hypothetical protein